ncbi:MAG: hypothetical protein BJ554DRAFT_1679, partial [Olpidium bornovanus]
PRPPPPPVRGKGRIATLSLALPLSRSLHPAVTRLRMAPPLLLRMAACAAAAAALTSAAAALTSAAAAAAGESPPAADEARGADAAAGLLDWVPEEAIPAELVEAATSAPGETGLFVLFANGVRVRAAGACVGSGGPLAGDAAWRFRQQQRHQLAAGAGRPGRSQQRPCGDSGIPATFGAVAAARFLGAVPDLPACEPGPAAIAGGAAGARRSPWVPPPPPPPPPSAAEGRAGRWGVPGAAAAAAAVAAAPFTGRGNHHPLGDAAGGRGGFVRLPRGLLFDGAGDGRKETAAAALPLGDGLEAPAERGVAAPAARPQQHRLASAAYEVSSSALPADDLLLQTGLFDGRGLAADLLRGVPRHFPKQTGRRYSMDEVLTRTAAVQQQQQQQRQQQQQQQQHRRMLLSSKGARANQHIAALRLGAAMGVHISTGLDRTRCGAPQPSSSSETPITLDGAPQVGPETCCRPAFGTLPSARVEFTPPQAVTSPLEAVPPYPWEGEGRRPPELARGMPNPGRSPSTQAAARNAEEPKPQRVAEKPAPADPARKRSFSPAPGPEGRNALAAKSPDRRRPEEEPADAGRARRARARRQPAAAARRKRAARKERKKSPNAPKKPLTPFFSFYCGIARTAGDGARQGLTSTAAGELWKTLTEEQKEPWVRESEQDRLRYVAEKEAYMGTRQQDP